MRRPAVVRRYTGTDSGRAFQYKTTAQGGAPGSNWNSDFWRTLGAPWGGMTTTVGDMSVFCQALLALHSDDVTSDSASSSSPSDLLVAARSLGLTRDAVREMTRAHTHGPASTTPDLEPACDRREIFGGKQPSCWGLGWRVNHGGTELKLGTGAGPSAATFGHHGAVGAMIWCDPSSGLSLAVASPEPDVRTAHCTLLHSMAWSMSFRPIVSIFQG